MCNDEYKNWGGGGGGVMVSIRITISRIVQKCNQRN